MKSILRKIETLLSSDQSRNAHRLFEMYFAVDPQQSRKYISTFQKTGKWQLPSVPKSISELEQKVRELWGDHQKLKSIEFYRLHTNCSLKESSHRVQDLCSDISLDDEDS